MSEVELRKKILVASIAKIIKEEIIDWACKEGMNDVLLEIIIKEEIIPLITHQYEPVHLEEIVSLLDIYENDMGFCEISNHIPYADWKATIAHNEAKGQLYRVKK